MVQNNMVSTKMRIKSKWIKSNLIQKYERRPLGLKNVWSQCLFSKGEGVFEMMAVETEIVSKREVLFSSILALKVSKVSNSKLLLSLSRHLFQLSKVE